MLDVFVSDQPTVLPSITSEFKESNQASWIGTSYVPCFVPVHPPTISLATYSPHAPSLPSMDGFVPSSDDALLVRPLY